MVSRPTYTGAMEWFAQRVPELRPLLDRHVEDNGETLPYVVFESDFMRWFKGKTQEDSRPTAIDDFLAAVEICLAGPADELSNLVWIGFVEHLLEGGPGQARLIGQLKSSVGPATAQAFAQHHRQSGRLAGLAAEFSRCRCLELDEVVGEGTFFHKGHLVWLDECGAGLNVMRCPVTRSCWVSCDARGGYQVRMQRFDTEADAMSNAKRLLDAPSPTPGADEPGAL